MGNFSIIVPDPPPFRACMKNLLCTSVRVSYVMTFEGNYNTWHLFPSLPTEVQNNFYHEWFDSRPLFPHVPRNAVGFSFRLKILSVWTKKLSGPPEANQGHVTTWPCDLIEHHLIYHFSVILDLAAKIFSDLIVYLNRNIASCPVFHLLLYTTRFFLAGLSAAHFCAD